MGLATLGVAASPASASVSSAELEKDVFNLRDFSAEVVDGDWQPAFVAALEAAKANGGGIIIIPIGEFILGSPVEIGFEYSHINIRGVDRNKSVLKIDHSDAGLVFGELAPTDESVDHGHIADWHGNFTVDGMGTAAVGVCLGFGSEQGFREVTITSVSGKALAIHGRQNTLIENVHVRDSGQGVVFDYGAGGNLLERCEISGSDENVAFLHTPGAAPSRTGTYQYGPQDNKLISCIIERSTDATIAQVAYRAGNSNFFIGCHIVDTQTPDGNGRPLFLIASESTLTYPAANLHLVGCTLNGWFDSSTNEVRGVGFQFETGCSLWLQDLHLSQLQIAFYLGTTISNRISVSGGYREDNVTQRFASSGSSPDSRFGDQRVFSSNYTKPSTSTVEGTCITTSVDGDNAPRFGLTADGSMRWGFGAAPYTWDLIPYPSGLRTNSSFRAAKGLATMVLNRAPVDNDFPGGTVTDGMMVVDSANNRLYVRVNGQWLVSALSQPT